MWKFIRVIFFKAGFPILWNFIFKINKYAKNPDKYDLQKRYNIIRKLSLKINRGFHVEYHVLGKENIPDEAAYYTCNHLSMYDCLSFITLFDKPTTFVAKVETSKIPFVGKIIQSIGGEFLDRKDLKKSLKLMMRVQDDLCKKNKNWVIFPEGTRNKDQMAPLLEFHHGTFRPAIKSKSIIVPVATYGSFRILKLKPSFKKYPVYMSFLKPITPEEYEGKSTEEIAKLVQDRIQKEIYTKLRKFDDDEMSKISKKDYRFNEIF